MQFWKKCKAASAVVVVLGVSAPAAGQGTSPFALDSVVSIDAFRGENVSHKPQIMVDISGAARISDNMQAYFRPWFRLPRPNSPTGPTPDWVKELWQAGIRYERPARAGSVATRVDVGYNVSP